MLKNIKKRLKNQRGLTLVELLAVVVILGIIAAIAVPSIGGIIDKTKKDAQVAEAVQIISAAKLSHASNSKIVSWKHEKRAYVAPVMNGTVVVTPAVTEAAGLKELLDNVKNVNYEVNYNPTTRVYSITDHPASTIVNNTTTVTEADLLGYTN
jgi:type IV pilus assembly protein PilA